ncbi:MULTISPECIES: hypothetical protein [unclassified Pantoea]|uniref:hypothetical protein n=1 Tax=unclassified Pantoea TaxID=2630326 RepID=UPI001CD2CE3F|nr:MULTISPECIES: hypothetical protein [unclassified Pantoea]MCA1179815.1 hypothetical protein [Pantoea sp. alder69]MCA1253583.1 hypothetical protein [Pantoea sp. alder70]MCA1268301.1 hypothetical protein [Pantoea sp. alder81]
MARFEHINSLLLQLTDGSYNALDTYLNNCNHLREHINGAMSLLRERNFEEYIIENDAALYYNLQSVMLAMQMLKNLLENLAGTMKHSILQPSMLENQYA